MALHFSLFTLHFLGSTSITIHRRFGKADFVKHILPALEVYLIENGYNSDRDKGKEVNQ
jgi:hypothetical protein